MKKMIIVFLLGLFTASHAQKQKKYMDSKEIIFSTKKYIFHTDNQGNKTSNFVILNNQQELNQALNGSQLFVLEDQPKQNTLAFPKNQKVILYHFGEFRSGEYEIKGIDKIRLVGDTLEVYLTREKELKNTTPSPLEGFVSRVEVQIVTRPRMIFSIPKKLKFRNIVIR